MNESNINDPGLSAKQHHEQAAEYHDQASKYHREAAKQYEAGNEKEAELHSHAAFGFAYKAAEHGTEANKKYADGKNSHASSSSKCNFMINSVGWEDAIASGPSDRQVKVARYELHTPYPRRTIPDSHPEASQA